MARQDTEERIAGKEFLERYEYAGLDDAFERASAGIKDGQITDNGMLKAIESYSGKYDTACNQTKVAEFVDYAKDKGCEDIPDKLKGMFDKYKDRTREELEDELREAKKSGNRDKAQELSKVVIALDLLKQYVLDGVLYSNLVKENTKKGLEGLVEENRRG
ncbi:hypothetical protein HYT26_04275 [Candidatus Pacearchaeota archaeon]|nr:hypothetical protein [Candidatus Pacearchaeota archaeon]